MTKVEQALHELRLDMARRIVAYAKSGSTDRAPSVVHFDVATYVDSQQYAREYQKLFRETPLLACYTVISVGSVTPSGFLVSIHRLFPHSVSELTTKLTMYAPHGVKSPEHRAEIEASHQSIMRAVREEDYSVTGESYLALSALPAGTKFPVGRQEIGVQNFHRNVERLVGT